VFDAIKSAHENTVEMLGRAGRECGRMVGVLGRLFWEPENVAEDFGRVFTERRGLSEVLGRVFAERPGLSQVFGCFHGASGLVRSARACFWGAPKLVRRLRAAFWGARSTRRSGVMLSSTEVYEANDVRDASSFFPPKHVPENPLIPMASNNIPETYDAIVNLLENVADGAATHGDDQAFPNRRAGSWRRRASEC
jgi:hypothetical protein